MYLKAGVKFLQVFKYMINWNKSTPNWTSLEFKYLQPKSKDNILEIKENGLFDKEKSVEYFLFIT